MKQLEFDVAVIGGGPAGTVAAIASARRGAKTILVEQNGYLGGALTACGTGPQMTYHAGDVQVVRGIPQEMEEEMIRRGFSRLSASSCREWVPMMFLPAARPLIKLSTLLVVRL